MPLCIMYRLLYIINAEIQLRAKKNIHISIFV